MPATRLLEPGFASRSQKPGLVPSDSSSRAAGGDRGSGSLPPIGRPDRGQAHESILPRPFQKRSSSLGHGRSETSLDDGSLPPLPRGPLASEAAVGASRPPRGPQDARLAPGRRPHSRERDVGSQQQHSNARSEHGQRQTCRSSSRSKADVGNVASPLRGGQSPRHGSSTPCAHEASESGAAQAQPRKLLKPRGADVQQERDGRGAGAYPVGDNVGRGSKPPVAQNPQAARVGRGADEVQAASTPPLPTQPHRRSGAREPSPHRAKGSSANRNADFRTQQPVQNRPKSPSVVLATAVQQQRPLSPPIHAAASSSFAFAEEGLPQDTSSENEPLFPCKHCGRKFRKEALDRHLKICVKVFQQQRKQFNAIAHIVPEEAQAIAKKAARTQRQRPGAATSKAGGAAPPSKVPNNWKQKSEAFRAAIRDARIVDKYQKEGRSLSELPPPRQTAPELDDRVPCPHCGRRFGQQQAERHIPHCKNTKSRPNAPSHTKSSGIKAAPQARPPAPRPSKAQVCR